MASKPASRLITTFLWRSGIPASTSAISTVPICADAAVARRTFTTTPNPSSSPRPFLSSSRPASRKFTQPLHPLRRTLFIQTEPTPNENALKFIPGTPLFPPTCPPTTTIEYFSGRTAHSSPLARKLFALDGITSVFFTPEYLTLTKSPDANWAHLKPEVFSLITEFLNSGAPVVLGEVGEDGVWRAGDGESSVGGEDTAPREGDSEVVSMIKELLDTRIRPAIQEDGGDIEFRGFDEDSGVVRLKLRGACRTCDSSTVTLKNGIESMLMHYVEEVKAVEQVLDQEEEIALKEFEKFEEKLRKANAAGGAAA
ncbi:scaffold protein Nfu/NifU N terminal-domain-containing protein [Tirmania nivea]|nr:scaffold protein Nfu/NifU N terminal-domain-containing protein [Tirmania nivea]